MIFKLRSFYLFTGLTGGVFTPYLSLLLIHDGLTSAQIGLMMGLGTLVSLFLQPVLGMIVDRYQITRMILIIGCVIPAVLSVFYNRPEFLVLAIINILSSAVSGPQAPLTDTFAVKYGAIHKVSYGSMRCFGSFGFATAGYIGGLYLMHFPIQTLYLLYAAFGLMAALIVFFFPKESQTEVAQSVFRGLSDLFHNKRFMVFLCGGFLVSQTLTAFNTYFAIAFKQQGGTMALTGLAFFLASGTNVPSMLIADKVIKKLGSETTLTISALAYILRWSVQAFFPNPYVSIMIQVLHGLSFGFFYVTAVYYVSKLTSRDMQATGQSVFAMITGGVAGIVGNVANGYLLHTGGPALMYEVCAASSLVGCVCFVWIGIQTKRASSSPFSRDIRDEIGSNV